MGNSDSTLQQNGIQTDKPLNEQEIGYRIINVMSGSPAEQAGLEKYLDFIKYNPYMPGVMKLNEFLE
jgi:GRASP55/65 PDZ-like domain